MKQNLAKEGCKLYLRVICSLPAFDLCLMYNPSLISAFAAPGLKCQTTLPRTHYSTQSKVKHLPPPIIIVNHYQKAPMVPANSGCAQPFV